MRPLKLTMEGFGSYLDRTVLDFTKFGDSGIYLICGNTASGKTTIFDAICWALYGQASGQDRGKTVRSNTAGPETPTYVDLVFEHQNQEYRIYREGSYKVPKKRGSGLKDNVPQYRLTRNGVDVPFEDLTRGAEEIIGLNVDQFRKVVMIPQMAFREVLQASTAERQKIFRQVFGTQAYQNFQDRLEEKKREALFEKKAAIQKVEDLEKRIQDLESPDPQLLKQKNEEDAALCQAMQKRITQQEQVCHDLNRQMGILEKEKSTLVSALEKARQQEQIRKDLEQARKQASLLEKQIPQTEEKKVRAEKLRQEIPVFEERQKKERELETVQQNLLACTRRISDLEEENQRQSLQEQELVRQLQETGSLEARLKTEQEHLSAVRQLEEARAQQKKTESQLKQAQETYLAARKDAAQARQEYDLSLELYQNSMAGILAQNLESNQPCPVCGSLDHPHPASLSSRTCSKEELEALRSFMDERAEKRDEAARRAERLQASSVSCQEQTRRLALLAPWDPDQQQETIQQLQAALDRLPGLQKRLEKIRENLSANTTTLEQLSVRQSELKTRQDTLQGQISVQLPAWEYKDTLQARKALESMRTQISQEETALLQARQDVQELEKRKEHLAGAAGSASEEELRQTQQRLSGLSVQYRTLQTSLEADKNELARISLRLESNAKTLQELEEALEERKNAEKNADQFQDFYDVFAGHLSGSYKISLETYVLKSYFQRILQHASRRLEQMSHGRLTLFNGDPVSQRGPSGLDISVRNLYDGSVSAASNLSGGEKFMASLALALGTSDEVQAAAGGISMDAFFIDEGFGTLDDDLRETVISVLSDLAGTSKMIGIISHTDTLNRRVGNKIRVTKDEYTGRSSARVVLE